MIKKQQQETRVSANGNEQWMSKIPEGIHSFATHDHEQFHDLARRRIERDRAARHARCAIMRK